MAAAAAVIGTCAAAPATALTASAQTTAWQLPPGVQYDASVHPLADPAASTSAKTDAVLQVARSKLGTPYIWGHNEDRGQYGFDCSNFTAYVYHHALGYRMSGASQVQARSVGWPVAKSQMRPGDLLIFDNGHHVGIYAGGGEMIQEGGGLGKVGYLQVSPGSYWYRHLTAVKRMY
ncbi:MAG: C40 family peptidase [Alicyclobacillaceae bacterium]|nr:C40 family peptidase [Alicyclobacillaceae bacterium]